MGLEITPSAPVNTATGVATFLATPSSANLAAAITDETGTAGSLVFSVSPAITGTGSIVATTLTGSVVKSLGNGPVANLNVASSDGATIGASTSQLLFGGAAAVSYRISENGQSSTTISTNDSYASHIIGSQLVTESTGTHAMMCNLVVNPLTVTNGAGTTTDAATVYINGPMTGVTPTGRNDTLKVNGTSYITGRSTVGTGVENTVTGNSLTVIGSSHTFSAVLSTANNSGYYAGTVYAVTPTTLITYQKGGVFFKSTEATANRGQIMLCAEATANSSNVTDNIDASSVLTLAYTGKVTWQATNTTVGTTGNQTINKTSGTVNIAAAGTTVTVTNSLCATTSIVFAVIRTNDATARISNVVPGAGSFVINIVACTSEVSIGFIVYN